MPLISIVGRRFLPVRLLLGGMYLLLTVGAITMLYPFGLMFSVATTSQADSEEFRLVPKFWFDDLALFKKYIVDAAEISELATWFGQDKWFHANDIYPRQLSHLADMEPAHREVVARDVRQFIKSRCPDEFKLPLFVAGLGAEDGPLSLRAEYMGWLEERYESVDAANEAYVDTAVTWFELGMPREHKQLDRPPHFNQRYLDWREFMTTRDPQRTGVLNLDAIVFEFLAAEYGDLERLNLQSGLNDKLIEDEAALIDLTYDDLRLGRLGEEAKRAFFLRKAPLRFVTVDVDLAQSAWTKFLADEGLDPALELSVRMPPAPHSAGTWALFVQKAAPLHALDVDRPEMHWWSLLEGQYGSVEALNKAHGIDYATIEQARLPPAMAVAQYDHFLANHQDLRWRYLTHNFITVIKFVAVHGHALQVTVIYIVLLIGTTLTINPLAAYALSRFRLKETHHVLVFLLATMAFPGEVLMIPSFLMIKSFPLGQFLFVGLCMLGFVWLRHRLGRRVPLIPSALLAMAIVAVLAGWALPRMAAQYDISLSINLLNTFWALVLPGLANGFGIFLLKGFFDSLPPELYEAGLIDGAGELRMFWRITLPLCKPIMAVMALGAFTAAYGAFMHAFLVCQDPRMWTLMVFLYEFQQNHTVPMIMASLVIAAVPTLLVFLVCQRFILRGIVIPTFK